MSLASRRRAVFAKAATNAVTAFLKTHSPGRYSLGAWCRLQSQNLWSFWLGMVNASVGGRTKPVFEEGSVYGPPSPKTRSRRASSFGPTRASFDGLTRAVIIFLGSDRYGPDPAPLSCLT